MSNLVKFGAKGADGTAKAVACDNYGYLLTNRNWCGDEVELYNGTPSNTNTINVQKLIQNKGLLSLRVINTTGVSVKLELSSDVSPNVDMRTWGFQPGTVTNGDFSNGNSYQRQSIATIGIIDITEPFTISVKSGYTLTAYKFNDNDEYSGSTKTIPGDNPLFTVGNRYRFRIGKVPNDGPEQTSADELLSHVSVLKNIIGMTSISNGDISAIIPNSNRMYAITADDWPILNYLNDISLNITPQAAISSGNLTIKLMIKQ